MTLRAATFVVGPWSWDAGVLACSYRCGDVTYEERFDFGPPDRVDVVDERLARAFDLLAVTAGVSYYKTTAAPTIELASVAVADDASAQIWVGYVADLYDRGMREFRVTNALPVPFVPEVVVGRGRRPGAVPSRDRTPSGALVPMGGGRDSLLVAHALRGMDPVLMTVGSNPMVVDQAMALGLGLHEVRRTLDPRLLEANRNGALNGHVPVTAINSCVAIVLAVLLGRADVVLSNERSASAPTRIVNGVEVNHQYSKSGEFEEVLRRMVERLGVPVRYFSALRGHGELAISELIGRHWHDLPEFVSCNRARVGARAATRPVWCGDCAKCRFVHLALAPFVARSVLADRFGRDLLATDADVVAVERLLLVADREFECLGTPDETRTALRLAAEGDWSDVDALVRLAERYPGPAGDRDDEADAVPVSVPSEYRALLELL